MDITEIRDKFPQYSDLSDQELVQGLHKKFYSDIPFTTFSQQVGLGKKAEAPPEQPQRSVPEQLLRQGGLAVRQGVEGLASFPGIFINPFQQAAGTKTMSQATSDLLTRFGLPQEETDTEKLVGAVNRAVSSGGGSIAAAKAIPAAVGAAPALVNNLFTQQPALQAAQAGIGAGAGELTRQAGGDTWAQLLASAVAPVSLNTVAGVTKAAARGANEIRRPLTAGGAKQIAADVVGGVASDKNVAAKRIEDFLALQERAAAEGGQVGVPGSKPTAGAVSADYGLIGGEQVAARGPANPDFAARLAANNEARLADLAKLRANKEQVATYVARRDEVTAPLREGAFANATGPVNYQPVVDKIMRLTASPAGGRGESQKALSWITERVGKHLDEGRVGPDHAYALYQDIGDLVAGKVKDANGAALRLSGGLANDVKRELGREINKVAPGFDKYLETYARLSKPIDRLEIITQQLGGESLKKVTNATPQAGPGGPQFGLSQAKMRNVVSNIEDKTPLAPYQRDVLGRVMGDLNSEALALRGGKMPGSDTYQNMATANLLSGIFGKQLGEAGVLKGVTSPLNFAFNKTGLEARIQNIINEAYLDPKKMAELLRMARTQRSFGVSDLATQANQNIYGGLLGGAATQP